MTWMTTDNGERIWVKGSNLGCQVPGCSRQRHARGLCMRHYGNAFSSSSDELTREFVRQYAVESQDAVHWVCDCPQPRRDDRECPECRRVSFSPERINQFINQFINNRETAS